MIKTKIEEIEKAAAETIDSELGQTGYVMGYLDAKKDFMVDGGYKELLPNDEESSKWFDENIGSLNDHSASSAIHKFRMWLNER